MLSFLVREVSESFYDKEQRFSH